MTAAEVVDCLDGYRRHIGAPVQSGTEVAARASGRARLPGRDRHRRLALPCRRGRDRGPAAHRRSPAAGRELPAHVQQLTAPGTADPSQLGRRPRARRRRVGVRASRSPTSCRRRPRGHDRGRRARRGCPAATGAATSTRGWTRIGQLDERCDEVDDLARARRQPSLQLVGTPERRTLDLNALAAEGVRLVGRLVGTPERNAQFSGSLANLCANADLKLDRLLRPDRRAASPGTALDCPRPTVRRPDRGATAADPTADSPASRHRGLGDRLPAPYPWLDPRAARPRVGPPPRRGRAGARALRARAAVPPPPESNLIDGVGADAADLADHLLEGLTRCRAA